MPNRPSNFIWYELMTTDIEAAVDFYGAVVGWSVQAGAQSDKDYRAWLSGETAVGGLMAIPEMAAAAGMRPIWLGYLYVADVDDVISRVTAVGGAVHMPASDIPGVGRIAMVTDPQGAAIYVMTPIGEGVSLAFAPGRSGHIGWNELHARDGAAALDFYSAQFGWSPSKPFDMGPMGVYRLFGAGDGDMGGMMNSPTFPRPMWLYYFNVDDIQTARSRVEAAGGKVLNGPHEVPGGGWIIQAHDPQGAMFALVAPAKT